MADTAARLVDQVFPCVPVRQWVLSFPIEIRYRLAYDGPLLTAVLHTFMEHLDAFYRGQAEALRTTHVVFSPHELIEKLVALVPPPRAGTPAPVGST